MAATDGEKKALVIVNHSNDKDVTLTVNGFNGAAKVSITDGSRMFEETDADLSALTLGANAIALIEA